MTSQTGERPGGAPGEDENGGQPGGWSHTAQSDSRNPFRAFGSINYTYYWIASLLSITSFFMLIIARGWLVFELTESEFWVGAVGAAAQLPSLFLSIFGGVIADRFNRKKVLLVNEASNFTTLIILAILVATDNIEVWHLVVLGVANGVTFSLAFPARAAIVPSLVPPRDIATGTALSSIMFSGATFIGPPIAGLLIAIEPSLAFFAAAGFVGLGVPLFLLMKLGAPPQWAHGMRPQGGVIGNIIEGLRHIKQRQILLALMAVGFVAVFFGMPYQTMLPVFAEKVLDAGPQGLGMLGMAGGIGATIGSLVIATFNSVNQLKGWLAAGSIGLGIFVIGFALSPTLIIALIFALGAGWFFQLVMTGNFALLQVLTPDHLRGRVLSIRFIVFGMSPFAILATGFFASDYGAPLAVAATGGMVLIGTALTLALFPSLRTSESDPVHGGPPGGPPLAAAGGPPSGRPPATD